MPNDHTCYCDYSIYCEPVIEPGRKGYLVTAVVVIFRIQTAKSLYKKERMNKLLSSIFFDPSHPASFLGPQKLYEAAVKQDSSVTLSAMKSWLSGEETYTFHKPSRKKIKRNRVFVRTIDQQWDVDLMDMTKVAKYNDIYHYILLAIDIFSRYVWTVPLRDQSGNEVVHALSKIFMERVPETVRSDKGTEFLGHKVQSFYSNHTYFVTL